MDPIKKVTESVDKLNKTLGELSKGVDKLIYWINPIHWFSEGYEYLNEVISHGAADVPFMAYSIVLVWLCMLGVDWAKKLLFWSWVIFWILRGFIFV